jgi:hypothetical protein
MKRHGTHGCGARWVVSTYNSSTQDAEEGGSQVRGQPGLHRETISPKNNVGGAIRSLRDDWWKCKVRPLLWNATSNSAKG